MSGKIKLVGKTTIGGVQFDMSCSDGAVQKAHYGITDDFYGGMLKEFRKIKGYDGMMLCLDKRDNVINVAYVEDELTDAGRELLGLARLVEEQPLSVFVYPPNHDSNVDMEKLKDILSVDPTEDAKLEDARNVLSVDDAVNEIINAKATRKR